ncbi:dynein regulatory complex protein 9 isoform X2 [Nannospalax galili]|uniref:Dynein regulatory complex protein 9 n=1 Tax=Nannospalax galili TaxID=1026970 RepID=A0A8C6QWC1_NANGA|nr:dynein regulatory complex protein 9 isoform X2 [Nannospalax galili]
MEGDKLETSTLPPKDLHSEVMVAMTGEPPTAVQEEVDKKDVEIVPEVIVPLSLLDVLRIRAVMEDVINQLSILGYIMPIQYERKQSISAKISQEKPSVVPGSRKTSAPLSSKEVKQGGQQDFIFKKPMKQAVMTLETMKKIQNDRQFFSDVIANTMKEMQESGSFSTLLETLSKERESKMHFYGAVAREEEGRKQIKSLQTQLIDVKKEHQMERQNGNEYIARLKDQLQEMKAKPNLETLYMKRNTELQIAQNQKKCEEVLLDEIEKIRMKTEEENQVHMAIETFLKTEQQKLEKKLEFWMEKFDKDTETKQNELNALQAAKASDLSQLQDLAKMIREYEQVITEDQIEKEKIRKKIEQDELELKSIIKLQAWWRGTVVRREIGGFKMPKKGKDGSKASKDKGKKKRRGKK